MDVNKENHFLIKCFIRNSLKIALTKGVLLLKTVYNKLARNKLLIDISFAVIAFFTILTDSYYDRNQQK